MAREAALAIENNFSKGLITEATGLNYPENASTETYNCIYDEKGTVYRRLGIDFEDGYTLVSSGTSLDNKVINEFVWDNVSSKGDLTFVVVQLGATLYFYEVSSETPLSDNRKSFTVDLNDYYVNGTDPVAETECQFASGKGDLFVTSPSTEPFYVTYDLDDDDITTTQINIKIRDFKGIPNDGTASLEERPKTLSKEHKYNLFNQGWYFKARTAGPGRTESRSTSGSYSSTAQYQTVLDYWDKRRSDFPSNVDVWWALKDENENINFEFLDVVFRGNTRAPNGHYLLNPFYEDRSAVSGVTGLTTYSSRYRPRAVAFFASRVFYSGVPFKEFGTHVYFSQIVENKEQYGKCYQDQDPTSEELNELLPTDGGVIVIPDMGTVITMFTMQQGLLVFASNGVWVISGSEGIGFTANDYSVAKLSSIGALDHKSFVDIGGIPLWWTRDGIYTLIVDPQTGGLNVASLSDQTIREFVEDIPESERTNIKGAFNQRTKIVEWLFRSTTSSSIKERYQYDRILVLNTITQAFYPHSVSSIDSNGPFLNGIVATSGQGVIREDEVVFDSTGAVITDNSLVSVTVPVAVNTPLSSSFRYLTFHFDDETSFVWKFTFANQQDSGYVDWLAYDGTGTSFSSYLFTGYKVRGQAIRSFNSPYVMVFMETEDDASLFLEGYWGYVNNENSGRVSSSQQCYKDRTYYGMSYRKLHVRGSGIALQMKFSSQTGKPFTLVGWSSFDSVGQIP